MSNKNHSNCYGFAFLFILLATIISASVSRAATSQGSVATNKRVPAIEVSFDITDFGEGWKASFDLPETKGIQATTYHLWVEEGWLHVARVSEVGIEWRLVFVKVADGVVPRAIQYVDMPSIEITYADEKYFIRDNSVVLRALRPPFDQQRPTFEATDVIQTEFKQRGHNSYAEGGFVASAMSDDTWFYAMSGPSREKFNAFIRLNPYELRKPGFGFSRMVDDTRKVFHGDSWTIDDGELLVAQYTNPSLGRLKLNAKKIKEHMADNTPPELEAAQWFNVEKPLSLAALKGKVVLIDFWATTCGPCIKKLPEVQRLYDKYAEQGLVAIGMHMPESLGACEKFIKAHEFTFPFMLDAGKTAESYGVSSNPTYFLISREGKVVSGYDTVPPSDEMIEMLLK